MTNEFEIAIDALYQIFAKYPFKSKIEGCPCCVSDTDKSTLHSKPLRKLEDDDLAYYAFKAMSTFGNLDDFKHYLPRIFELSAKGELTVDTFVILNKLEDGNWLDWDKEEQITVRNFLKSWWKYSINNKYFDSELVIELNKRLKDLAQMLDDWNLDLETQGFKNYVDFITEYYYVLKRKKRPFKEFRDEEFNIFTSWVESNAFRLEKGFFKFEGTDKEFSDQISNTLYIFERIE